LTESFDTRLVTTYGSLSAKLQLAADYVVANPVDTATRSLRSFASESGVAPATFSRLAKALDYENFDALRDVIRTNIGKRIDTVSARAERLHTQRSNKDTDFMNAHMDACLDNFRSLNAGIDRAQLSKTVKRLGDARKVALFGVLGSYGVVDYMAYMASFLAENWFLAGRGGASMGSVLASMDERDAMIIVTKPPFAPRVLKAAKLAKERGIYLVVISDSYACEALAHASSGFVVPSKSPHFFSSYTATVFLVETIIGELAAQTDTSASKRISDIEHLNIRMQDTYADR